MTSYIDRASKPSLTPRARQRWHAGTLSYGAGGLVLLFGFLLLGDFAWSLKERTVQDLFKVMLREMSQNALVLNALIGALPALITMTLGPAVGAWSDRTRTRLGRRIPFLLGTAPVIGLGMVGLAYSVPLGHAVVELLGGPASWRTPAAIASMALFWTIFECGTIIGNALFTALINDTVPHVLIGRFYGVFRIFSLAVGSSFFYFFFDNGLTHILRPILLAVAAVYVACFLLLAWGVKEGGYPAPRPRSQQDAAHRVRAYLRDCVSVKFYVLLFVVFALASSCFYPININAFNAKDQFGLDKAGFGQAMAVTYVISMALAYPMGWLADRVHPLRIGLATLVLYGVTMFCGSLYVHDGNSFRILFVAHGVLSGMFYTGTAALLLLLLPQVRFSELAAASTALTSLTTALASLGTGALLDLSGRDFRLMFLVGGALACVAALGWVALLRAFERLGGVTAYIPPGA